MFVGQNRALGNCDGNYLYCFLHFVDYRLYIIETIDCNSHVNYKQILLITLVGLNSSELEQIPKTELSSRHDGFLILLHYS